jgi:hypothetical protein
MRTIFFQIRLLNDSFEKRDTSFILYGKERREGKTDREREREQQGKE